MTHTSHRKRSRGFTLVEALVALVVLGVGMLGIASLYVVALKSGKGAISRMQAVNLATDIADRIRANTNGGVNYDTGSGQSAKDKGSDQGCYSSTANCAPEDMALTDLADWAAEIDNALPGSTVGSTAYPRGTIVYTAGPPNSYLIKIEWIEPGQNNAVSSYQLSVQL